MTTDELGQLVVRLMGDATSYMKMLAESQRKTEETVRHIEKGVGVIEGLQGKLEKFGSVFLNAAGAAGLAIGFWKSFEAAEKMEEGMIRLNAAISQNGGDVVQLNKRYLEFAKSIQDVTTMSKGEVFNLLRRAETMGFTGDVAEKLARQSIGLAGATDMSAESAMRISVAIERGNPRMLMRVQELRMYRTDTEKMAAAQNLMSLGMRVQEQLAETTGGKIKRMQIVLASLGKEIGAVIADGIRPFVMWLEKALKKFNELDPKVRKVVTTVLALSAALVMLGPAVSIISSLSGPLMAVFGFIAALPLGPILLIAVALGAVFAVITSLTDAWGDWQKMGEAAMMTVMAVLSPMLFPLYTLISLLGGFESAWNMVKRGASDTWIAIQFGFKNFQRLASFVWTLFKLRGLQAFEEVKHFFTSTFPELTTWFLNHWQEVLTDFVNLGLTMTGNLATNIVNIITSIPDLISGAVNWEDVWRPLTDGFESAISEFPNLTTRQISEVESQLREQYAREELAIGQSFDQFRHEQLAVMNQAAAAAGHVGDRVNNELDKGNKKAHKLDAALFGSAEALSRIAAQRDRLTAGGVGSLRTPSSSGGAHGAGGGGSILGTIDTVFNRLRDRLVEIAINVWNAIKDWAFGVWTGISDWAVETWNGIVATIEDFWEDLPANLQEVWDDIVQSAFDMWDNITDWALATWDDVKQWAFDMFDAIDENVAWFIDHWPEIAEQAWTDITAMAQTMWDSAVAFWEGLPERLATIWEKVKNTALSLWNSIPAMAEEAWERIQDFASDAWREITRTFQDIINRVTGSQTISAIQRQVTQTVGGGSGGDVNTGYLRTISAGIGVLTGRPQTVLEGLGLQ